MCKKTVFVFHESQSRRRQPQRTRLIGESRGGWKPCSEDGRRGLTTLSQSAQRARPVTANYWALTQSLVPAPVIGRMVGIQACAASLPGIVAPRLTGWLKQASGGYDAPMQIVSLFLAVAGASYWFVVRDQYAPQGSACPEQPRRIP